MNFSTIITVCILVALNTGLFLIERRLRQDSDEILHKEIKALEHEIELCKDLNTKFLNYCASNKK